MTQRLTYRLETTNSLSERQHGFREGKSVDTAINELINKIQAARSEGKHVLVLSIDIKGAFDNLQHKEILKSLDESTYPLNINRLFHSLLQNRKVTLMTPEGRAMKDQKQGCPQGSCSGPALWNLVANEILKQAWPDNVHIQAFADDFVLIIGADTKNSLERETQLAIAKFNSWCSNNQLSISTEKTTHILFSKMTRGPKITWNGDIIKRTKSIKYLGVHIDDQLNWLEHIEKQGEKAIKMHQSLKRIAGSTWGISQKHRRVLYKTVVERMLAHGSSAWCLNPTYRMKRKLSTIQRPFLLYISGAYRTTPTAALQTILGIPPLHMQLQLEARLTTIYRLRIPLPHNITEIQPEELEKKVTGWSTHPSRHLNPNQISLENEGTNLSQVNNINIFTDGSKTEHGVGAAFCVLINDSWSYHWSAKLNDNNTVFQAELTAFHEAVKYTSKFSNNITFKIHVDNRASIMASSNPKSTNQTAREIFGALLSKPTVKVSWVKAHAGNIGNEKADQLAKDATQNGQIYMQTKLPKPHIKALLRKNMLVEWQGYWSNCDTGRKVFNILPLVNLHPTNWIREDIIFFSEHGPFPAYLKRFNLSESDLCSCGGIGTALHYATECILTISWHMKKPSPSHEQEWLKRVASNFLSRQKIHKIIKFISENRDLFLPP